MKVELPTRASTVAHLQELSQELRARPALLVFLGLSIALSSGFVLWHLLGIAFVAAALRDRRSWCLIGVAALVGWILRPLPVTPDFDHKPFRGVVEVMSIPSDSEQGQSATVAYHGKRYRVYVPHGIRLNLGDVVELGGQQEPPNESRTGTRGITAVIHPIGGMRWIRHGPEVFAWGTAIRRSFMDFAGQSLSPRAAATLEALCMGADYGIDDEQWEAFKRTGTVHVIVASGLQTMIVGATALTLLAHVRWRRELKLVAVLALLFLYCAVAGFRPSVLRAGLMVSVGYLHYLFGRQSDGLNSLGLASSVALVTDPWQVFDLGLWLSFVAVAGLVMQGTLDSARPLWKQVFDTNLAATVATAPLTAWALGQVSLIGIVANLAVVPAMESLLVTGLLSWLLWLVLPPIGGWVGWVSVGVPLERLLDLVFALSRLPFAAVNFGGFSGYWLVPVYGGMVLLWRPRRRVAD